MGGEWVADPRITWRILLTARPLRPVAPALLADRQAALHAAQGWPAAPSVRRADSVPALMAELAEVSGGPLALGVAGADVVVSGYHGDIDGLGLLEVLTALVAGPVSSSSRGLDDGRPTGGVGGAIVRRMAEVALAPPARIAASTSAPAPGDAFAQAHVEGSHRTADLVHAGVAAVVAHNAAAGRGARHVTVSVGAGRRGPDGAPICNRSELFRLRDLEGRSRTEVHELLQSVSPDGSGGYGAPPGRFTRAALRTLAPRLGATLLVSHLGQVTAPGIEAMSFSPVTAGGSGVSLGAVGFGDRTTLTLRARGSQWDDAGLAGLLAEIAQRL